MPLRLSFESGALAGVHVVTSAPSVRLGRDPQHNDILLSDPKVSRRHAVIERSVRGGYSIEIVGSAPSRLNGDPFAAIGGRRLVQPLSSGDRLQFGGIDLTVAEAEVRLMVVAGPSAGREILVGGPVRIGSGRDCNLVLGDPTVAEEHLVITSTPLGFRAEARALTLINGARATTRVLSHGDELVLGQSIVRFAVRTTTEERGAPGPTNAVGELVFIAGGNKGTRIPLGDDQIILGTRADCTVVLSDLLSSALHCAISKAGDELIATDLGSECGTYINGERIFRGTALAAGDLIAVGGSVLESRLIGGVTVAAKGNTIYSIRPDAGPQPRFVLDGRVINARRIVLGRAPSCDLILDGAGVSREHCGIEWGNGFVIRDTSAQGTYVDDRRIVQHELPPSGVLRIVDAVFRFTVRGEVCTLERADAAQAQAAVDVARAQASRFVQPEDRRVPGDSQPLRTIFRMDAGAVEHEIASRKKQLRRNAPAWRPSSDLARNGAMRGAVVLSVLAAIAVCGSVVMFGRGKALMNHPLSAAHGSVAFAQQAGGTSTCSTCHGAGARVDSDRCATCHTGFLARGTHTDLSCAGCHPDHQGPNANAAQLAMSTCASCHEDQHARELAGTDAPQKLAAGPLPASTPAVALLSPTDPKIVALHATHSRRTVSGAEVGIGCTSCHARIENGVLASAPAGLSCFRCHTVFEGAATSACERCHGGEHAIALTRLPPGDPGLAPAAEMPSPLGSVGWAIGIALAGGTPCLLLAAWIRVRRRRTDRALVETLKAHPAEVVKRLVHSINDSKCVGCGLCVQACPASVLELVDHKSRVINFDSCIQCNRCERACAFDALRMHDADKPPPMIPMPSIDAFHETPVPGMFLIGQASGTPQVKNATNLGRAAIQRIVQQGYAPGSARALGCDVDVVIAGSGPAGLSAAITCIELGLSYVVLEKERASAWTIRNYFHKGKEVMAEPHDIALEASLPHWNTTREELLGAWDEMVVQHRIDVRYQHSVLDVTKAGDQFTVQVGDPAGKPIGRFTTARVVLAIGTLGNPRKLGCPGEDLEKVKNSLVDPDEWSGKNILVVGGSDSAVEVVLALCAPHRQNRVWYSTRGAKLEGIKPKNLKAIEEALAAGRFTMCHATTAAEVTPGGVVLSYKEDGRREAIPNDVVFAMIGGGSPQKWLQQLGIPYVDKPHSWSPPRTDILAQKTAEGLIQVRRLVRRNLHG